MNSKQKIIILGSTGFVGVNLLEALKIKFDIIAPVRSIPKSKVPGVEYISLNDFWKDKIDCLGVINLVGKAHDLKNVSSEDDYFKANVDFLKTSFDWFEKSSGKIFIHLSSVKAVCDHSNEMINSATIESPKTIYGVTKLKGDAWLEQNPIPGKTTVILRPSMIHGPGNKGNLNLLYSLISKGIPYPLGSFENKRSFLSVQNLCFVVEEILMRNEFPSGKFLLADKEPLSTNQIVQIISNCLGKSPRIWFLNKRIVNFAAKFGDVLGLPVNSERLEKLTENYTVDSSNLIKEIGQELPLTSFNGLSQTIKSFNEK
jgi:nucleoside-diphosphate-sugar epimerase